MGEIVVLEPDDIFRSSTNSIEDKELPTIIANQITKLNELDQGVKKAMNAASRAKEAADTAKTKSVGFFKKKEAIEELQSAGIDLAEAVQSGAEAQKISFEFQTKLAEITKYLFGLGVSNIASNRFVVRELEMKLKGASKEKLSELAKQEVLSVVKQLKDQEDILKKQENLSQYVKIHDEKLKEYNDKTQEIIEQLKIHKEDNVRLEEQMQAQAGMNRLHSEQLHIRGEVDKSHGKQIKIQTEQLKVQNEILKKYEDEIAKNSEIIEIQESKINFLQDEINKLKVGLETKANETLVKNALGLVGLLFVILLYNFVPLVLR